MVIDAYLATTMGYSAVRDDANEYLNSPSCRNNINILAEIVLKIEDVGIFLK